MMYYRKPGMRLVLLLFLLSASLRAKTAHGALLNLVSASSSSGRSDDDSAVGAGPLQPLIGSLRTKYKGLTPKGKFIAMAATGFIGSRLVMDVAATSLKVAGAVFIVYVFRVASAAAVSGSIVSTHAAFYSHFPYSSPFVWCFPVQRRSPALHGGAGRAASPQRGAEELFGAGAIAAPETDRRLPRRGPTEAQSAGRPNVDRPGQAGSPWAGGGVVRRDNPLNV
jgi:hypothetical protein